MGRMRKCEQRIVGRARAEIVGYLDDASAGGLAFYENQTDLEAGTAEHADALDALDGRKEWSRALQPVAGCKSAAVVVRRDAGGNVTVHVGTGRLDRAAYRAKSWTAGR